MPTVACGGAVTFDVPLEGETVIEGQGLLGGVLSSIPAFSGFSGFDLSSTQEFENNNAEKDRVTEAYVTAFSLSATAPSGASLDFMDSVSFYVEAPDLSRTLIGEVDIPAGATSVDLELTDDNLADYVKAETMSFTTEASGAPPEEDTTVKADVTLTITAELVSGV